MKIILRILRALGFSVLAIVFAFVSYVLISGNNYLFFTVQHTILKGRLGPSIDEYAIYPQRKVSSGSSESWPIKYKDINFNQEELAYHSKYGTAAFVLIKNDTIVFEYYDEEHNKDSYTNPWSMSKSIVSLLIGIAIDEGIIESEQVLLSHYFPQYEGSGISIEHLLNMSSGINFTEDYINPFAHSARSLYGNDLVKLNNHYVPTYPPGQVWDYQGGNTVLLAMLLTKASGMTLSEFASEKLWKPIRAEHPAYWSLDHEGGMERAFCCFNTNARDFARIGKLLLYKGVWGEDTIISQHYLNKALSAASQLKGENGKPLSIYGYQWWILQMDKYQGYYARGIQGQYMVVLPEENMVLVRFGHSRPSTEKAGHVTDMLYYIDMARRIAP